MDANAVGLHRKNNGVSSRQSTQIVESIETEPSGEQRKTVQWTSSHDDCKNDDGNNIPIDDMRISMLMNM